MAWLPRLPSHAQGGWSKRKYPPPDVDSRRTKKGKNTPIKAHFGNEDWKRAADLPRRRLRAGICGGSVDPLGFDHGREMDKVLEWLSKQYQEFRDRIPQDRQMEYRVPGRLGAPSESISVCERLD
ncbi:hypothetical protein PT974_10031 [Cladobotryum mycophilum]|uniref:Uncharacterized protein n=1 Tax=Cladobotryum mycophilum TaxID=491253 RepID=A0ABR0S9M1_9HYPO